MPEKSKRPPALILAPDSLHKATDTDLVIQRSSTQLVYSGAARVGGRSLPVSVAGVGRAPPPWTLDAHRRHLIER